MISDLQALADRRSSKPSRVNNADLPAGANMYYYCQLCEHVADILPEEHEHSPRQYCSACQKLIDAGWSEAEKRFVVYEDVTCPSCGGSGKGVYDYYLKRRRKCSRCNGNQKITVKAEKAI